MGATVGKRPFGRLSTTRINCALPDWLQQRLGRAGSRCIGCGAVTVGLREVDGHSAPMLALVGACLLPRSSAPWRRAIRACVALALGDVAHW
ncbi:hypothetical protein DEG02_006300 [Xanthomonas vasicola]|nr:hypothetical protein NX80_021520 [Xanthomonas vasicola pv. arecae]AZR32133.1 hypothetical protein KWO_018135 [Xanthomonas vasicola pv. musacearum NCPPB 4379]RJL84588.1 hypothetical protein DEG03_007715 [Xanthomonas vasicola]RRJ42441.1 hypothetical protein EIM46_05540 [Xanthomonas vasicola pv. musacearum]RJL88606.1 hypothetical protein DEF98_006060 [Xanthomonas vasicola]